MSQNLIKNLTKCLIDTLIAIEYADEDDIDNDFAVNLLEQISAELQALQDSDKAVIIKEIKNLAPSYPIENHQFLKNLAYNLGVDQSN